MSNTIKIKKKISRNKEYVDNMLNLKSRLPNGAQTRIHNETGLAHATISRVLSGQQHNSQVIKAALKIISEMEAIIHADLEDVRKVLGNNA